MESDVVAQFTEVTGSRPELAAQYLQICDFNIEQAMTLYFENGGAPLAEEPTHANVDPGDDDVVVDESRSTQAPTANIEDDEAMARRLQEEMYSGGGGGGDSVRAPMGRTTETLVDDDDFFDDDMPSMHSEMLRRARGG